MDEDHGRKVLIIGGDESMPASLIKSLAAREIGVVVGGLGLRDFSVKLNHFGWARTYHMSFAVRYQGRIERYQRKQPRRYGDQSKWTGESFYV